MRNLLYHPLFIDFSCIVFLIIVGFLLRMYKKIQELHLKFLNELCIQILLPCFIISSFMKDIHASYLSSSLHIIIWALLIHGIFFFLSTLIYKNNPRFSQDQRILLSNILPLGNVSFYGTAINTMAYGITGIFVANIYSIINRSIINTAGLMSISGLKITKKDLVTLLKNPALVSSIVCSIIFFTQDISPQIIINNTSYSIFRIDQTLPFIFNGIQQLGSILSTVIWIIIGASITKKALLTAFRSSDALIFAIQKSIIFPILGIIFYILLSKYKILIIDSLFAPSLLMLLISPVASTLAIFAIKYERDPDLCIACLLTSTIFSLLLFPLYKVFFEILIQYHLI